MNKNSLLMFTKFMANVLKAPLIFLSLFYSIYYTSLFLSKKYDWNKVDYFALLMSLKEITLFIAFYWVIYNTVRLGGQLLMRYNSAKHHLFFTVIFPPIYSSLSGALFIIMMNMLIYTLNLPGVAGFILAKLAKIILILVIANVFYKIICSLENYIMEKYIDHNSNLTDSRKIHTQLMLLKRIILFIGALLTFIAIIMLFDSMKGLGASLLTTAGVISAIGAFASQQSLGRLFAGLQLAFTQPMRIGDTVVVDNELGQVEEITLSFITVKLWDLRRLILPTDYFTNKGLLNLTRQSSELLGTIYFYTDYTLPVENIRNKFHELLNQSAHWNKKTASLEVTDVKEMTLEVRCLVSSDNASSLWKLRCEIREKLINYIVEKHYHCLAKTRTLNLNNPAGQAVAIPTDQHSLA